MSRWLSRVCDRNGRLTSGQVALAFAANCALGVAASVLTFILLTAARGS